jgi:uncharacterized protein (TIGR02265 family)
MAQQRLMYAHAFEALFARALHGELSERCRTRLHQAGLDLERPLLPAYPIEVWVAALEITVAELFPELPRPEGYRRVGERLLRGYVQTFIGRANFSLLRLLGPVRALERLSAHLRANNNFQETRLTPLGTGQWQLWINTSVSEPAYYEGLLQAALEEVGAPSPRVHSGVRTDDGCTYRITWGPQPLESASPASASLSLVQPGGGR